MFSKSADMQTIDEKSNRRNIIFYSNSLSEHGIVYLLMQTFLIVL